jgi:hypothetical protein
MPRKTKIADSIEKATDAIKTLLKKRLKLEYPKHYMFTPPATFVGGKYGRELRAIAIRPKDRETTAILIAAKEKVLRKAFPNLLNFGFTTSYGHPSKNFYIRFKENWHAGTRKPYTTS